MSSSDRAVQRALHALVPTPTVVTAVKWKLYLIVKPGPAGKQAVQKMLAAASRVDDDEEAVEAALAADDAKAFATFYGDDASKMREAIHAMLAAVRRPQEEPA